MDHKVHTSQLAALQEGHEIECRTMQGRHEADRNALQAELHARASVCAQLEAELQAVQGRLEADCTALQAQMQAQLDGRMSVCAQLEAELQAMQASHTQVIMCALFSVSLCLSISREHM